MHYSLHSRSSWDPSIETWSLIETRGTISSNSFCYCRHLAFLDIRNIGISSKNWELLSQGYCHPQHLADGKEREWTGSFLEPLSLRAVRLEFLLQILRDNGFLRTRLPCTWVIFICQNFLISRPISSPRNFDLRLLFLKMLFSCGLTFAVISSSKSIPFGGCCTLKSPRLAYIGYNLHSHVKATTFGQIFEWHLPVRSLQEVRLVDASLPWSNQGVLFSWMVRGSEILVIHEEIIRDHELNVHPYVGTPTPPCLEWLVAYILTNLHS